jgi:hypothetical protein
VFLHVVNSLALVEYYFPTACLPFSFLLSWFPNGFRTVGARYSSFLSDNIYIKLYVAFAHLGSEHGFKEADFLFLQCLIKFWKEVSEGL